VSQVICYPTVRRFGTLEKWVFSAISNFHLGPGCKVRKQEFSIPAGEADIRFEIPSRELQRQRFDAFAIYVVALRLSHKTPKRSNQRVSGPHAPAGFGDPRTLIG